MKKKDVPQDDSGLVNFTKELYYAQNEDGEYTTALSQGWDVKSEALDVAWDEIKERVEAAHATVKSGEASPILFFMELKLMDMAILAAYTGFWKWTIKRHLKPNVFRKLSDSKLEKYASAFNISIEELKEMKVNED